MRIAGAGSPFALDYTAVMMVAMAQGADVEMLVDVLPAAEAAIIGRFSDSEGGDDG